VVPDVGATAMVYEWFALQFVLRVVELCGVVARVRAVVGRVGGSLGVAVLKL
jgi:hypothetical protein